MSTAELVRRYMPDRDPRRPVGPALRMYLHRVHASDGGGPPPPPPPPPPANTLGWRRQVDDRLAALERAAPGSQTAA